MKKLGKVNKTILGITSQKNVNLEQIEKHDDQSPFRGLK